MAPIPKLEMEPPGEQDRSSEMTFPALVSSRNARIWGFPGGLLFIFVGQVGLQCSSKLEEAEAQFHYFFNIMKPLSVLETGALMVEMFEFSSSSTFLPRWQGWQP